MSVEGNFEEETIKNALGLRVADHISAMLAYWDSNQVCRFANKAYELWFGRTREEMINKITMKELLGPLYEQNLPYIQGALQGQEQMFERAISLPNGGGIRYSMANYYPDIQDGVVKGFFVHVADITPIKQLQLKLETKEKELLKSFEIIEEQNQRLLNFTHLVSHNLKTHAGNLTQLLNILRESQSEEEKQEMLGLIQDLSAAFNENVAHLNEISEAKSQVKLPKEMLNLHHYIQNSMEVLALNIHSFKATIINKVDPKIEVLYNPAYLESILLNLLSNALKYRHPDRAPIIEFSVQPDPHRLVLSIRDNGKGIDLKRYGDKLFGLYRTFHGNADAKGVGLFIVKYQAEVMGGDILVESEVGQGSVFNIYIPAVTSF